MLVLSPLSHFMEINKTFKIHTISFFFPAYIRLFTNVGVLNLELHSDLVPKTCENFLKHCHNGYYNGTKFHRSIRNFMVYTFPLLMWV